MSNGTIIEMSASNFREIVSNRKMTLINFTEASGTSKELEQVLQGMAQELSDRYVIGNLDVHQSLENKKLVYDYGVMDVPTLLLFFDGVLIKKIKGRTLEDLRGELSGKNWWDLK
ncbi:thioredoxin family protein [Brevibacillus reuszeri]|uniref:thioredoxin family protein n=1 Tax=Brevibacillus reuszeri TaxID=54915 RepID=UPI0028993126|nr:thioredoxin family protein [Brevibacillus reuszeri]